MIEVASLSFILQIILMSVDNYCNFHFFKFSFQCAILHICLVRRKLIFFNCISVWNLEGYQSTFITFIYPLL